MSGDFVAVPQLSRCSRRTTQRIQHGLRQSQLHSYLPVRALPVHPCRPSRPETSDISRASTRLVSGVRRCNRAGTCLRVSDSVARRRLGRQPAGRACCRLRHGLRHSWRAVSGAGHYDNGRAQRSSSRSRQQRSNADLVCRRRETRTEMATGWHTQETRHPPRHLPLLRRLPGQFRQCF